MSNIPRQDPRKVAAEAAVEQAQNGDLPHIGSYNIRDSGRQFTIAIPQVVRRNVEVDPRQPVDCYSDFTSGLLVIDLAPDSEDR